MNSPQNQEFKMWIQYSHRSNIIKHITNHEASLISLHLDYLIKSILWNWIKLAQTEIVTPQQPFPSLLAFHDSTTFLATNHNQNKKAMLEKHNQTLNPPKTINEMQLWYSKVFSRSSQQLKITLI